MLSMSTGADTALPPPPGYPQEKKTGGSRAPAEFVSKATNESYG
jgi:hypothetical protein